MLTEQEAKKKWCPQVRVSDGVYYAAENRTCHAGKVIAPKHSEVMLKEGNEGINWDRCLASDCMMWRWCDVAINNSTGVPLPQEKQRGYCGLSGKI